MPSYEDWVEVAREWSARMIRENLGRFRSRDWCEAAAQKYGVNAKDVEDALWRGAKRADAKGDVRNVKD